MSTLAINIIGASIGLAAIVGGVLVWRFARQINVIYERKTSQTYGQWLANTSSVFGFRVAGVSICVVGIVMMVAAAFGRFGTSA